MVDTIILDLEWGKDFTILEGCYGNFSPDATNFFRPPYIKFGTRKSVSATCNPTKSDDVYMPRLTLIKAIRYGSIPVTLRIECSMPKVVFGNNFDELIDSDLDIFCEQLKRKLYTRGVVLANRSVLRNGKVMAIHYSKNIALTDYSTALYVVQELSKCNYTTKKHTLSSKYRDDGTAMHYYSKKWALCIYDKLKELQLSKVNKSGLLEKDNACQLSLFDDNPVKRPFEVLRIEARYLDRRTIKKALSDRCIDVGDMSLQDLFRTDISKTMLLAETDKIRKAYPEILLSENTDYIRLYTELVMSNSSSGKGAILEAIGMKVLLEQSDSRTIRSAGQFTSAQWYRLQTKMNSLSYRKREHSTIETINKQLKEFTPLKLQKYLH